MTLGGIPIVHECKIYLTHASKLKSHPLAAKKKKCGQWLPWFSNGMRYLSSDQWLSFRADTNFPGQVTTDFMSSHNWLILVLRCRGKVGVDETIPTSFSYNCCQNILLRHDCRHADGLFQSLHHKNPQSHLRHAGGNSFSASILTRWASLNPRVLLNPPSTFMSCFPKTIVQFVLFKYSWGFSKGRINVSNPKCHVPNDVF